jgi:hypothetical protein
VRGELSIEATVDEFRAHYGERGYRERSPVPLMSPIDPTVRFVGSTVSVLKPLILSRSVPAPGVFLVQPALRTRNLAKLLDDRFEITSPSYFLHAGVVSPPALAARALTDACSFLSQRLATEPGQIVLRVSAHDADLRSLAARSCSSAIEVGGEAEERYRHSFGMPGIRGRNLNFGGRAQGGAPRDFGNFIAMERAGAAVAYETAIGVDHLVAAVRGLGHPIRATPARAALPLTTAREIKLADALATVVALLEEGLLPVARGRGRTLRGYLEALAVLTRTCGRTLGEIEHAAADLARGGSGDAIGAAIRAYLQVVRDCAEERDRPALRALALSELAAALGRADKG